MMKYRLAVLGIALAFGLGLTFGIKPAQAVSGSFTTLTFPGASATNCGQWELSGGTISLNSNEDAFLDVKDGNGTEVGQKSVFGIVNPNPISTLTGDFFLFPVPQKNPIHALMMASGGVTLADLTADDPCLPPSSGGSSGGSGGSSALVVTFFTTADNRVDPRPGDRLDVRCIAPDILHIVAADSSVAVGYARFKLADLLAAGQAGLSKPLLSYVTNAPADGGIISASATRSGGQTYFYIAWNGGKYNATGQGDFTKAFASPNDNCAF